MRTLIACAALVTLGACSSAGASHAASTPAPSTGTVGFVRVDDVLKVHPLYTQLAQYDETIAALNISSLVPRAANADPALHAREAQLERELDVAAKRTNALLAEKSKEYQTREAAAIAAALRAAGATGRDVGTVSQSMRATAQAQTAAGANAATADEMRFRREVDAQDRAHVVAVQRALAGRADRQYRARADELQSKESALSLKMANDDATARLALRTKLTSLALDDAARDDVKAQLAALDRKEADALAAARNRDQADLTALQARLRTEVTAQMQAQVAQIHATSLARLRSHDGAAASGGSAAVAALPNLAPAPSGNVTPALRARLSKLHDDYAKAFQADARATVADFNKTRESLRRRFAALHGVDASSAGGARAQIATLQQKRDQLYDQMVAQIDREVNRIAQRRGISFVGRGIAGGGVDLTDDAMKDIETFHE